MITTGLSKNLALGGWRLGVARLPAGGLGRELRARLLGIGSEIWSAPAGPVQQAAALAFSEPPELTERVALSRRLHASVARAVALRFAAAGAAGPAPQAAFYLYPDFSPLADVLLERHGITSDESLAARAPAQVRRRRAAGQRVRRGERAAAAAGGDRHALRRHRQPSAPPR